LEDPLTGEITPSVFKAEVPAVFLADVFSQATNIIPSIVKGFPWYKNATTVSNDPVQLILNRIWRAGLAITGISGLPNNKNANNVIIPQISYQISLRIPPSLDTIIAQKSLKELFEKDPPYGATIIYDYEGAPVGAGWMSPPQPAWLSDAIDLVSQALFQQGAAPLGDGGTVPVLNAFQKLFPKTLFFATGVAGPGNNEHAANENLNIRYAKQLSSCLAFVISEVVGNVQNTSS